MSIASFSGIASGVQWRDMIDQIMALEARPAQTLRSRIKSLEARVSAWGTFKSRVQTLSDMAKSLGKGEAFEKTRTALEGVPSGGKAPFSLSTAAGAAPGRYNVRVLEVATAEKLGSATFPSGKDALGLEGEFLVNGARIQLEASDTLEDVARRINATNTGSNRSGVSATVLAAGEGGSRLVLTSERTGAAGIDLVDGPDGVLGALGVLGTSTTLKHQSADAVRSDAFKSATAPITELRPFSGAPALASITLGPPGYSFAVSIDPSTDSLEDIAAKINAAAEDVGIEISASVATETVDGETRFRLEIQGTSDFADPDGLLESLGVLGREPARRIAAGTDAKVEIDGDVFTRASNTIADVIPGVTLTLTAADPDLELRAVVNRDTDAVVNSIQALVKGYNDIADFVAQQMKVTGTSRQPLAGDAMLRGMRDQLRAALQGELPDDGTGAPRRLGEIGIEIDREGHFTLDAEKLRKALESNPEAVQRVFGQEGGEGEAQGIGKTIADLAAKLLGANDGSISSVADRIQEQTRGIDRQATRIEDRLELRREVMEKRFIAMEQAISKSQSQADWLLSQINALTAVRGR